LVPAQAVEINDTVCFLQDGDRIGYFAAGVPLFSHAADDTTGRRVAAAQMATLGLAKQSELSAAFGVNRTTLYRQQRRFAAEGIGGLVDEKRGPKGPHKLTESVLKSAQQMLDEGQSKRATAASATRSAKDGFRKAAARLRCSQKRLLRRSRQPASRRIGASRTQRRLSG
jgi:transposase